MTSRNTEHRTAEKVSGGVSVSVGKCVRESVRRLDDQNSLVSRGESCCSSHKPCQDIGRAALLRRLDIGAAQQHSPTQWCAAFMPLQCAIFESVRIAPMLWDVPTLRRNKFRDPPFIDTRRPKSQTKAALKSYPNIGRAAMLRIFDIGAAQLHCPATKN